MLLTPHEILNHLGFDVPENGVRINPDDAYLITTALKLIGRTLNVNAIPENKLDELHNGLAGIVAALRNEKPAAQDEDSALKLRIMIEAILAYDFNRKD